MPWHGSNNPDKIIALTNSEYWLENVSDTFHGRDILAPVAAHLSLGITLESLGDPLDSIKQLAWPEVNCYAKEKLKASLSQLILSVILFPTLLKNSWVTSPVTNQSELSATNTRPTVSLGPTGSSHQ